MVGWGGIVVPVLVPPFRHGLERVIIASCIYEISSRLYPFRNIGMGLGIQRFHIGIGHNQHFGIFQCLFESEVLDVHDSYRDTGLEKRH